MKIYFIFLVVLSTLVEAKVVYFTSIPGFGHEEVFYQPYLHRDEVMKPFFMLRVALEQAGHQVKFTSNGLNLEDADAIISLCDINPGFVKNLASYPKEKCFLILFEPPVTSPAMYAKSLENTFGKIFTMFDEQVDNKNYFKIFYPQPREEMIENVPDFSRKKLAAMICGNKSFGHPQCIYSERRNVIAFFEKLQPGEFDLYGGSWNGHRDWKGMIPNKWDALKNYKFSFCYENMGNQKGYITEKIFDSFIGGCVPIYLGATNITDYIPSDAFIDRRNFSSEKELYQFLKHMNRETYEGYIAAIKRYLASPKARLYYIENFVKIIEENLYTERDSKIGF